MIQVGKPRGHGLIRWTSADPAARPVITSRLLDDPIDRAKAVDALEVALRCADTPAMRALATPVFPPTRVLRARAALDAWVRIVCDSGYHPCGTVPMGASAVEGAVDARGRVFGVEGLRVADASIMPTIPTCNTHLPTLMIGERIAEWVRDGD
ncbi:MAG: GMC family oxidoreductase [Polyangiales bacterium]